MRKATILACGDWDDYEYDPNNDTDTFSFEDDDGRLIQSDTYEARPLKSTHEELFASYMNALDFWLQTQPHNELRWDETFKAA